MYLENIDLCLLEHKICWHAGIPRFCWEKETCPCAAEVSKSLAHAPVGNTAPERAREQAAGTHGALTAVKAGGKA